MTNTAGTTRVFKNRLTKLITALRSGKYKQCRGQLKDVDKFCWAGVACDITRLGHWSADGHYVISGKPVGYTSFVSEYYGLPYDTVEKLVSANDTISRARRVTFRGLAQMTERVMKKLFG